MKKLFCIVCALLIVLSSSAVCFAARNADDLPNVYEEADIFTDAEEQQIDEKCEEIINKYNLDFAVIVFAETRGELMDTADAIYDENGFGCGENNSGALLYICMDEADRGWWLTAAGDAEKYYTEYNINYMDDILYDYMADGKYGEGVITYLGLVDELYANGGFKEEEKGGEDIEVTPQPVYTYSAMDEFLEIFPFTLIPGIFLGIIVGLISLLIAKKSMKTVAVAHTATGYLDSSSLNINVVRDIFLYRSTHRIKIERKPESPDSGHGGRSEYSGGHTSSSGVHHSGGGRHF